MISHSTFSLTTWEKYVQIEWNKKKKERTRRIKAFSSLSIQISWYKIQNWISTSDHRQWKLNMMKWDAFFIQQSFIFHFFFLFSFDLCCWWIQKYEKFNKWYRECNFSWQRLRGWRTNVDFLYENVRLVLFNFLSFTILFCLSNTKKMYI